jgi:Tol biopolymer transport system component/predicted Ser/Thr protein kinase
MVGQTLAHFTVLEKLGEGGMGEVYKARDNHLDRTVAIKVLPLEKVTDPDRIRRFTQEAKAASALNHPNIVTIYDIDTADGVTFIAMEYVKGKTLDRLIRGKRTPLNENLKNAVQIADALAAAHNAGIIHRDIKPANIMVSETGQVKLLDFGLAKLTEPSESAEEQATRTMKAETTEEGVILGTIAYMSPEQAEGKKLDARSDIFSFGSVLYEMITGRRAFNGETRASTMAAILRENPKPVSEVAAETPLEMEKIISRCLRKDPNRRFQHMLDLKLALEDLKEETESGRMVAGGTTGAPGRFRSRKAWLVGGTAVLVVTALGVGLWRLRPGPQTVLRSVPLTTYEGIQCCPSFSPDGNQVAFVWNGPKQDMKHIYVKLVGTDSAVQLTNAPVPDDSPSWSPDGRYIAFLRHGGGSSKNAIYRVPAIGGLEHKIAETSAGDLGEVRCPCLPPLRLSWSPDGKWVALPDQGSVFAFSVESGEKQRLTFPPPDFTDEAPAFSPDGKSLAFNRTGDVSEIDVVALSPDFTPKEGPKQLTFRHEYSWWPTWTAQGREVVFSTGPNWGQQELWRVTVTGRGSPQPSFTSLQGETPEISRRGDRLAYQRSLDKWSIWRLEIPGRHGKGDPPLRLISSTYGDLAAQYSADGNRIAFVSSRSGHEEIWVSGSDGSNPVQLTSLGAAAGSPSWSPDGQHIAFDSNVEGPYRVFVVDASGGRPRRLTTNLGAMASWSRDGRWIYFYSWPTEMQIWKISAEGGDAIPVVKHGGYIAIESQDGRFLYFSKDVWLTSIWRIPVGGGQETKVLDSVQGHAFAVSAKGVYFVATQPNGSSAIRFLSFATGQQTTVADVGKQPVGWLLSVTPD